MNPNVTKSIPWLLFFAWMTLILFFMSPAWSAETDEDLTEASSVMDGVTVDAIETYVNPKKHNIGLGLTLYPFNSYYNAFGISPSYTHLFSDSFGWEVLNFGFYSTVDKGLTTELADSFGVNPQSIDRIKMTLASHLIFTAAYGKVVLFQSNIRYYRVSPVIGAGYVTTKAASGVGPSFGLRIDFSLSDTFQWRFDVRDQMSLSGTTGNYVTFTLGTGVAF